MKEKKRCRVEVGELKDDGYDKYKNGADVLLLCF